ncbi:hypothetical protein FR742_17045 [Nonomuraea sp. C10]|nr:hypothetical protein FR742_17045 [Nonomuraea sp. C10]
MCGARPAITLGDVAFLRSRAARVTGFALVALYLLWGPFAIAHSRATAQETLLALLVGVTTWGCAIWLLRSRAVSGYNVPPLLVTVVGAAAMQAMEPYTGLGFAFFAAIAAPHRVRLRAAVPLTALLLAALPLVSYLTGFDMAAAWGMTAGMAYTVVFSFLIWHVSTTKRQAVEVAEARAGEAVLQERARLAREVHDILAHAQSAQIVHLEGARVLLRTGADPALALDRVERAVHLARVGLEETRRALDTLRGRDLPLPERLERLAAEFRATTGASCVLSVDSGAAGLSAEAKLAVARTAQEALTNVRKHAPGAPAEVSLRLLGRWCELEIRDGGAPAARLPGPGLSDTGSPPGNGPALSNGSAQQGNGIGHTADWLHPSGSDDTCSSGDADIGGVRDGVGEGAAEPGGRMAAGSGAGYGLIGMRERAELIGGSLTAGADDGGFAVVLRVPA